MFVEARGLKRALQIRDWPAFARGYNGTAYRENRYDERLAAAYALHHAAYGARRDDIDTPAVRLALRVLRPFLPDRTLLIRFWQEGKAAKGQALSDAVHAHNWIAQALVKQGHSVWAEFRL